jgi:hypothetical protein
MAIRTSERSAKKSAKRWVAEDAPKTIKITRIHRATDQC